MDDQRAQPEVPTRLFKDDTRFALGRIAVFQYTAVAAFFVLITGFWILQVRDESFNSELAERNRIKTVPLLAPRGKILDRDGRVIVDNQPSFTVRLTRENNVIDPQTDAKLNAALALERAWLIEDFKKLPPDVVLVDNLRNGWGAWARADPELSQLLRPYTLVQSVEGIDILRRTE